ncbi:hypothetical protein DM02DRAFT_609447 [Periconia macrospinosa]|uniref:Uncharacterized protein n=1 Tax=Periconia macrospinosa TaxID=97972 RepID=A0A2V1E7W8_9PLEO|nr:hypothetical protein DM02DRAFT_609447 [Periconia macrospinosa]
MLSPLPYSGRQALRLIKRDIKMLLNCAKKSSNKQIKNDLKKRLSQVTRNQPSSSDISQVFIQQKMADRIEELPPYDGSMMAVDDLASADSVFKKTKMDENRDGTFQLTAPTSELDITVAMVDVEFPSKIPSTQVAAPRRPLVPTPSTEFVVNKTRSDTIYIHPSMASNDPLSLIIPSTSTATTTPTTHTRASSQVSTTSTAATEYQDADSTYSNLNLSINSQSSNTAPPLPFSYAAAEAKLNNWYKARPLSHPDRWAIRGVVLVFTTAFCYSATNPLYESIFGHSFLNGESSRNRLTKLSLSLYDDSYGKAIHEAENLLKEVYPEQDEKRLLRDIGDVRVDTEHVKDDLREKLASMLLPEFAEL